MKLSYLFLSVCLLFPQIALGQICGVSSPLGDVSGLNWSLMQGRDLKNSDKDYPFLDQDARRNRYAQFWVDADVLNIRSGPELNYQIISETYLGDHVFAFAKQGEWVAISHPVNLDEFKRGPRWVHLSHLSADRISSRIESERLQQKCSFHAMGTYKTTTDFTAPETYNTCDALRGYLWHQNVILDREHPYSIEYKAWRLEQDNPEEFRQPFC